MIFAKGHLFKLSENRTYFVEVISEKPLYVRKHPQGLLFLKINISESLRHAHFEEITLLLICDQNVDFDTPRDSQEALWRLSGDWLRQPVSNRPQISSGCPSAALN